jgi:hypothetical protein
MPRDLRKNRETAALLEAEVDEAIATCGGDVARGFARYADREHVPGGRNRTIDRSNLNGFRAGGCARHLSG